MSRPLAVHSPDAALQPVVGGPPQARLVKLASSILRSRGERQAVLPAHFFGEPCWDILLALYVAQASQREVPVGAIGAAAGVPPTVALRAIALLERDGWVRRSSAADACGVSTVAIGDRALARLERWLAGHFCLRES